MTKIYVSGRSIGQCADASKLTVPQANALGFGIAADAALVGPAQSAGHVSGMPLIEYLRGNVEVGTAVRTADDIVGIMTGVGDFDTEEVRQNAVQNVGRADFYGDHNNVPLVSYKSLTEIRDVVRFEAGFEVGRRERAVQGANNYDAERLKRGAAIESLEIARNDTAWRGAAGLRVYGILNDPSLAAATGTTANWLTATYEQIVGDIEARAAAIDVASGGRFNAEMPIVLAMPVGYRTAMNKVSTVNASGKTVMQFIKEQFPNLRVVYTPELKGAASGDDLIYFIAEPGATSDNADSATFLQIVPARDFLLGRESGIKVDVEDHGAATAGVICLRPWFVSRMINDVTP